MQYVFGNTLICADADAAKLMSAREKGVRMKAVTLQGDVYNPSGTLEGGSAPASNQILVKVQALRKAQIDLDQREGEASKVEADFEKAQGAMDKSARARKALDLKLHEVSLLEARVSESNATRVRSLVVGCIAAIVDTRTDHRRSRTTQDHYR